MICSYALPVLPQKAGHVSATWVTRWVVLGVVAVFGPYLVSGLRTEQAFLYGSALLVLALNADRLAALLRPARTVLVLWAAYAATVIGIGLVVGNSTAWPSGSFVAGVDNVLLPLATIVTGTYWTERLGRTRVVTLVSWTLAWAVAVNAVIAIATTYLGLSVVPGLDLFWSARGADVTVAALSEQNGRFSGVFNQPAEAGIAYSLAVLGLVHLAQQHERPPRRTWVLLSLAVIGGLLTVSKIFILGGLLVAGLMTLLSRRHKLRTFTVAGTTVLVSVALGAAGLVGSWGLSVMLGIYRNSLAAGDSWIYVISAGRFGMPSGTGTLTPPPVATPAPSGGDDGGGGAGAGDVPAVDSALGPVPQSLGDVVDAVREHHPFGFGASGLQMAYDSLWTEALVVAGVVGAALMLVLLVLLAVRWVRLRRLVTRELWLLAGAVLVLLYGAALGLPALTANRESSLLWIYLVPLLVVLTREPASADDAARRDVDERASGPA